MKTRLRASSMTMIALLGLMVAACTASPAGTESAPSPSASPSVTRIADAAPTPIGPIEGGCEGLTSREDVQSVLGGIQRVTSLDSLWKVAIETAGGLTCSLLTTRAAMRVYIIPDTLATREVAELTAQPACETSVRAMECRASAPSPGSTTLVAGMFSRTETPETALSTLGDLTAMIAAAATPGTPVADEPTTWQEPLDCARLARMIGITSLLGSDKVQPFLIIPASAPRIDSQLSQAVTSTSRCDWSRPFRAGDRGAHFSVIAAPGGAWAWTRLSAQIPDSAATTIAGLAARITSQGDVYLSDGVNILHLEGSHLAGIGVADTTGGILSILNTPTPHTTDTPHP